jgi:succinate dehydrogenase hydrophobic anchor subunit
MNYSNMLLPICYCWFVSSSPQGTVRGEVRGEMSNSNMLLPICYCWFVSSSPQGTVRGEISNSSMLFTNLLLLVCLIIAARHGARQSARLDEQLQNAFTNLLLLVCLIIAARHGGRRSARRDEQLQHVFTLRC